MEVSCRDFDRHGKFLFSIGPLTRAFEGKADKVEHWAWGALPGYRNDESALRDIIFEQGSKCRDEEKSE